MEELLRKFRKNELNTCFEQKFATGSYGVGIGRAWCSRKACEICSSLVQKKKMKKNYFSSHKLPKQQSTIFWSQGILGVKKSANYSTQLCKTTLMWYELQEPYYKQYFFICKRLVPQFFILLIKKTKELKLLL
jgi:hypothetical protein